MRFKKKLTLENTHGFFLIVSINFLLFIIKKTDCFDMLQQYSIVF